VEQILETLAPLALLIALGSVLAHIKFLGEAFINDLNKLAFWVALPAMIFTSASNEIGAVRQVWMIFAVLVVATLAITFIAWIASHALGLPGTARGTLAQSAFRGNLAYIGLPVLTNSFTLTTPAIAKEIMTTVVIVMVLTMAFYNILAVIVLQASQRANGNGSLGRTLRSIATNPLMLAGLLGLAVPLLHLRLPSFVQSALQSLGTAAIPLALLCIGGSLVMAPLRGKFAWIIAAAAMKTAVLPLLVFLLTRAAGFDPVAQRIALVFSSCPTAAASFVMARQMGGDEVLASGSIALSTLLSAFCLAGALWLTT
jgi:predicted permease